MDAKERIGTETKLIQLFIKKHAPAEDQQALLDKLEKVPSSQYYWIAGRLMDAEPRMHKIPDQTNARYISNIISTYIKDTAFSARIAKVREEVVAVKAPVSSPPPQRTPSPVLPLPARPAEFMSPSPLRLL